MTAGTIGRFWSLRWLTTNPSRLWKRYVVAIGLIVLLLIGSQVAHTMTLTETARDASVINLSGRQRMLSQRILYLATQLELSQDSPTAAMLTDAVGEFENAHNRLVGIAMESPQLSEFFAVGTPERLDARARDYVNTARAIIQSPLDPQVLHPLLEDLKAFGTFELLRDLNTAVQLFEEDANDRAERLSQLQEATLILAILTIIIEAVLIFWPAQISINRALDGLESRNRDIVKSNEALQELTQRLSFAAHHDSLTGVANRKKLKEELSERLAKIDHDKRSICVMHLDLDRFKEVNDTLGHIVGDSVLSRAAEIMAYTVHDDDIVARVGGDEFVIVMDMPRAAGVKRAMEIAETLIRRICEPMMLDDAMVTVGTSIGIAFSSEQEAEADLLIGNADIALYEAKRDGKGVARLFTRSMREGVEQRHNMIQDIHEGLEKGQFIPFFQPQVSFDTGELIGFEVLARWDHPKYGLLPPADFIPLAEEIGVIDQIDMQVAIAGLDGLNKIRARGLKVPKLSINVAARSLRLGTYRDDLHKALKERGLSPSDIVVEVLETTLIEGKDDPAYQMIGDLASDGFDIYIDDFGTGYASLASLAQLDLSGMKIDKSLVANPEDRRANQVIAAVSSLADGLGLTIVAEGVETPQTYSALKRMKCHVAQGYGIGVPMSQDDAIGWMADYGASPQQLAD
ncbi:putative bifunctional diguanylate cyclase/phosphodiesterase [Cognatiyoonia sediminum]|uniref:putative bifunctional diguanylate cyclase/phosphodiesterase n=1 Tax=Cognatiyoonia sediminum TaxID=1508389 RepID=UPI000933BCD0|nr:EAL domain-containing protein [Cognatiyoonia sediminum]